MEIGEYKDTAFKFEKISRGGLFPIESLSRLVPYSIVMLPMTGYNFFSAKKDFLGPIRLNKCVRRRNRRNNFWLQYSLITSNLQRSSTSITSDPESSVVHLPDRSNRAKSPNKVPVSSYNFTRNPRRIRTRGIKFGNLNIIPTDPFFDPPLGHCFNCWTDSHRFRECIRPKTSIFCYNCGRRDVDVKTCPRCCNAYQNYRKVENTSELSVNLLRSIKIENKTKRERDLIREVSSSLTEASTSKNVNYLHKVDFTEDIEIVT